MTELKHRPVVLTDEQRSNLTRLADYLAKGVTEYRFSMSGYFDEDETTCGAVACAAGHGPSVGIPKRETEGWDAYCNRTFGTQSWAWCFSSIWAEVDNTPQGAAARIRYMLENGLPENALEQRFGEVPLCYEVTV